MTDFLTWWADHWPLIPAIVAWTWGLGYWVAWLVERRRGR